VVSVEGGSSSGIWGVTPFLAKA